MRALTSSASIGSCAIWIAASMTSRPGAVGAAGALLQIGGGRGHGDLHGGLLGGRVAAVLLLGRLGKRLRHGEHRADGDAAAHSDSVQLHRGSFHVDAGVSTARASLPALTRLKTWPTWRASSPPRWRGGCRRSSIASRSCKPVRVFMHYTARRGPILAAGLSYQAIFSVFAAVLAGFSVAGLVLRANAELRDGLFDVIATSIPGLHRPRRRRRRRDRPEQAARRAACSAGSACSP